MDPKTTPSTPTDEQLLAGGEVVTVIDRSGMVREIRVRQLRYSELGTYLAAEAAGELGALSVVTGETAETLDALTLASVEALVCADRRQNFTFARAYEQRRYEAGVRAIEGLREQMPERYAQILADLEKIVSPSPASSRVSLSPGPLPGATSTP
jgi:hypothetical protein